MYLSTRFLKTVRTSKKLDYKYVSLYRIKAIVNNIAYTLDLPELIKIHLTFYILLLEKEYKSVLGKHL